MKSYISIITHIKMYETEIIKIQTNEHTIEDVKTHTNQQCLFSVCTFNEKVKKK